MSKKRKHDQVDAEPVPAQGDEATSTTTLKSTKSKGQSRQEKSERRAKKHKVDSKEKRIKKDKTDNDDSNSAAVVEQKKKMVKSKGSDLKTAPAEEPVSAAVEKEKKKAKKAKKSAEEEQIDVPVDKAAARFIVFVGNLPFSATAAQVEDHFNKLAPSSVRVSTDKATGRGKGFAFVEFDGYDKMKTCLKLYHHSIFDPESKGKEKAAKDQVEPTEGKKTGRRINVELTAGGGGKKSKDRKERIKSKNKKLDEERERTRVKERIAQEEASRKKKDQPQTGANATGAERKPQKDNGSIHPSRLAQMNH